MSLTRIIRKLNAQDLYLSQEQMEETANICLEHTEADELPGIAYTKPIPDDLCPPLDLAYLKKAMDSNLTILSSDEKSHLESLQQKNTKLAEEESVLREQLKQIQTKRKDLSHSIFNLTTYQDQELEKAIQQISDLQIENKFSHTKPEIKCLINKAARLIKIYFLNCDEPNKAKKYIKNGLTNALKLNESEIKTYNSEGLEGSERPSCIAVISSSYRDQIIELGKKHTPARYGL